jgi:hypothetical protein
MRRLFYCGEWIVSHSLHIHLLAAPDFFGCENVIELARREPEAVRRGLRLQEAGNAIIELLGGRSVHPVGARVGGFSRAPGMDEVRELLGRLKPLAVEAEAMVRWCAALPLPDEPQDFESVALSHPDSALPAPHRRPRTDIGKEALIGTSANGGAALHRPSVPADGQPYLVGGAVEPGFDRLPEAARTRGICIAGHRVMCSSVVARALKFCLTKPSAAGGTLTRRPSSRWFTPAATDAPGHAQTPLRTTTRRW